MAQYIENMFHFYETYKSYEVHVKQGLVNPCSICFIEDTHQIYTHGVPFGICRERFERLEEMVVAHEAKLNNILGIEGPNVGDGAINTIADITSFLDGFTEEENLKDLLDAFKEVILKQIEDTAAELSRRITAIEESLGNDSDEVQNAINTLKAQLETVSLRVDSNSTSINSLSSSLTNHISNFDKLKSSYESYKEYVGSKFTAVEAQITAVNSRIDTLQPSMEELEEKFDAVEDEVAAAGEILQEAKNLIATLEQRFSEAMTEVEQLKTEVNDRVQGIEDSVGAPNGIAPLDYEGKIPAEYMPANAGTLVTAASKAYFPITGEAGKLYVDETTKLIYYWDGTNYTEVSESIKLGETSTTAYSGSKGKKVTDDLAEHRLDYNNPHKVTKAQVGLGNVDNTADIYKPISLDTQDALDTKVDKEIGKVLSMNDFTDEYKAHIDDPWKIIE